MPEDDVFDIIQADLDKGFSGVFSADPGYMHVDSTVPTPDGITAVMWQYHAVHDGDFLGLTPTGQSLVIDGVTIASQGQDGWQLRRYIDWMSVAGQLGMTLSGRPVVTSDKPPDS
jgi:hypothetical protein